MKKGHESARDRAAGRLDVRPVLSNLNSTVHLERSVCDRDPDKKPAPSLPLGAVFCLFQISSRIFFIN